MTRAEMINLLHDRDAKFTDDEVIVPIKHKEEFLEKLGIHGLMLGKIPVVFE